MQHYSKIVFDKETVDGIRAALKFYFSLELPQHCQIPGDQFIFLAEKGDIMRPFVHMRLATCTRNGREMCIMGAKYRLILL